MEALAYFPPITSTTTIGQTWILSGPGSLKLVVSSVNAQTSSGDPLVPPESLVGLRFQFEDSPCRICNFVV
jgi:hypothetical protein